MTLRICSFLLLSCCVFGCIEPYEVNTNSYSDLLVVDALITNENKNHTVRLTRSTSGVNGIPRKEAGALVIINGSDGSEEVLTEIKSGFYETDKQQFIVKEGVEYTLSIRTANGDEYKSDPCKVLAAIPIDKVHYNKKTNLNGNQSLAIMVNGALQDDQYLRWTYEEDWKFRVPYPTAIAFNANQEVVTVEPENVFCWKKASSNSIVIHSSQNLTSSVFENKIITSFRTDVSDKLTVRYSILVKQLHISEDEYKFLSKLKQSTEESDDFFGQQPYSVSGNIKSLSNPKESVLGYFQVGAVSSERVYIDATDVLGLGLPLAPSTSGCQVDTIFNDGIAFNTPYEIYESLVARGSFRMHTALFQPGEYDVVLGLILTRPACADCTVTGSEHKPDFWIEKDE